MSSQSLTTSERASNPLRQALDVSLRFRPSCKIKGAGVAQRVRQLTHTVDVCKGDAPLLGPHVDAHPGPGRVPEAARIHHPRVTLTRCVHGNSGKASLTAPVGSARVWSKLKGN